MSLSFLSLNIEADLHISAIEKYLSSQKPDIVALQEVYKVHAESFAKKFGYECVFAPHVNFNVQEGIFKLPGEWGICILSKPKILQSKISYYGEKGTEIPTHFLDTLKHPRALLSIEVEEGGKQYTFATTHFTWAMPDDADRAQAKDLSQFLPLLTGLNSFVLSGDFNAPRRTQLYQKLSTEYISWIPLSVDSTLDPILFRRPGLNLVVDHLFSTPDYQITNVEVLTGLSDHCALYAVVDKLSDNR